MTNLPGPGFVFILLAGISMILLFVSVLAAVVSSKFIEEYSFLQVLFGSYLGIGILSAMLVFVSSMSVSTLLIGTVAYLVSTLFFVAVPLLIGGALVKWRYDFSWDQNIRCASTGWAAGAGLSVLSALIINFLFAPFAPLTGFLGAVVGGILYAEYISRDLEEANDVDGVQDRS